MNTRSLRMTEHLSHPTTPRPRVPIGNELAEIARAYPNPIPPETFTAQLRKFAEGADRLMEDHETRTDELREALAENALLRARVYDLETHVDVLNDFWGKEWDKLNDAHQALSRLYYALTARLDGAVEFMATTRADAQQEALAPRRTERVSLTDRPRKQAIAPVENVHDVLERFSQPPQLGNSRLPPNGYPK